MCSGDMLKLSLIGIEDIFGVGVLRGRVGALGGGG